MTVEKNIESDPSPKKLRVVGYFSYEPQQDIEFSLFIYQSAHSSALAKQYVETFLREINADCDLYNEFRHLFSIWCGYTTLRSIGSEHFTISCNKSKFPSCAIKFKRKRQNSNISWSQTIAQRCVGRFQYTRGSWDTDTFAAGDVTGSQTILDGLTALTPELEVDLRRLQA